MSEVCGIPEEVFLDQASRLSEANPELTFIEVWNLWKSLLPQPNAMEEEFEEDYEYADGCSVSNENTETKKTWAEVVSGARR